MVGWDLHHWNLVFLKQISQFTFCSQEAAFSRPIIEFDVFHFRLLFLEWLVSISVHSIPFSALFLDLKISLWSESALQIAVEILEALIAHFLSFDSLLAAFGMLNLTWEKKFEFGLDWRVSTSQIPSSEDLQWTTQLVWNEFRFLQTVPDFSFQFQVEKPRAILAINLSFAIICELPQAFGLNSEPLTLNSNFW